MLLSLVRDEYIPIEVRAISGKLHLYGHLQTTPVFDLSHSSHVQLPGSTCARLTKCRPETFVDIKDDIVGPVLKP